MCTQNGRRGCCAKFIHLLQSVWAESHACTLLLEYGVLARLSVHTGRISCIYFMPYPRLHFAGLSICIYTTHSSMEKTREMLELQGTSAGIPIFCLQQSKTNRGIADKKAAVILFSSPIVALFYENFRYIWKSFHESNISGKLSPTKIFMSNFYNKI